jgi:hypothetical protein
MFRFFRSFFIVLIVSVLGAAPAKAGIIHSFNWDDDYKAFGAQFDSVVALVGHDSSGGSFLIGSGVIAGNNHTVLLSAHQFDTTLYQSYSVRTGTHVLNDIGGIYHTDIAPIIHPTWAGSRQTGLDLAILHFDNPIISANPANLYTGPHLLGEDYAMVGWGTVAEPGGSPSNDFFKRGSENVVNNINRFNGDYISATFREPGHSDYRHLGMLGAPGDSGGGWFIDVNGEYQLAGITSSAGGNTYGFFTSAAKLDHDWINSNLGAGTTAIPEPSSFLLFLFGSAGVFFRRFRGEKSEC